MQEQSLTQDIVIGHATISACETGQQPQRAIPLSQSMQGQGLTQDIFIDSAATSLSQAMQDQNIRTDIVEDVIEDADLAEALEVYFRGHRIRLIVHHSWGTEYGWMKNLN